MIMRRLLWFGALVAMACGLFLILPVVRSESKPQSATILSTTSNNGETSPCG